VALPIDQSGHHDLAGAIDLLGIRRLDLNLDSSVELVANQDVTTRDRPGFVSIVMTWAPRIRVSLIFVSGWYQRTVSALWVRRRAC